MRKRLLITLSFFFSAPCFAVDYFWQPKILAKQKYDTNLFMLQHPTQDNWVSIISPSLNFGLRSEKDSLTSGFTWNQLFYLNQSSLNVDEQLFTLKYAHTGDRLNWGLGASYSDQALVNTIDTGTVLGDPNLQAQINIKRQLLNIAPSVSYNIDERSQVALSYSYTDATFDKFNNATFIPNYNYHQANGTYSYLYSERDQLSVLVSGSRYKRAQTGSEQTTYNYIGQLGWKHDFQEKLSTFLSAGLNYSQSELSQQLPARCLVLIGNQCLAQVPASNVVIEKDGVGAIFTASVQKSFDRGFVSLNVSQNQTPTTQGFLTQTQFSVNSKFGIIERLSCGLMANYSTYESTGQLTKALNRDYYYFTPNLTWQVSPEIDLALIYTYRNQNFTETNISSQGNTVLLQFSYQPELNEQAE